MGFVLETRLTIEVIVKAELDKLISSCLRAVMVLPVSSLLLHTAEYTQDSVSGHVIVRHLVALDRQLCWFFVFYGIYF